MGLTLSTASSDVFTPSCEQMLPVRNGIISRFGVWRTRGITISLLASEYGTLFCQCLTALGIIEICGLIVPVASMNGVKVRSMIQCCDIG